MSAVLLDVFNRCSLVQLRKEIDKVSNFKHLLLRKTDVPKTSIFSERKFEEIH